jgi:hypothetical protein
MFSPMACRACILGKKLVTAIMDHGNRQSQFLGHLSRQKRSALKSCGARDQMARTCTVCRHPKRAEIDAALIRSESFRDVAGRFGTSKSALERHRTTCLPVHLLKAKDEADVQSASALVKELRELAKKTGLVLSRAMRQKDGELALKAIARLERQLELKARLLGELEERGSTTQHITVTYVDKAVIVPAAPGQLAGPLPRTAQLVAPEDVELIVTNTGSCRGRGLGVPGHVPPV